VKSLKTYTASDWGPILDTLIQEFDVESIINYIGRDKVISEITVDEFIEDKSESKILDAIGKATAMDYFNLIEDSE